MKSDNPWRITFHDASSRFVYCSVINGSGRKRQLSTVCGTAGVSRPQSYTLRCFLRPNLCRKREPSHDLFCPPPQLPHRGVRSLRLRPWGNKSCQHTELRRLSVTLIMTVINHLSPLRESVIIEFINITS